MTLTLKANPIFDIYEGEYPVKIEQMTNPKPLAVIARASWQQIGGRARAEDTRAYDYSQQCKAAGIRYGLYHFLTPNGIAEQASLFLSVWNKCGGADLDPIVDVEIDLNKSYPDGKGGSAIGNSVWQKSHVKTFLDMVEKGTGKKPIIYTNRNYWSFVMTKNSSGALVPPPWTSQYYLWVAQYPDNPDGAAQPAVLPSGWSTWAMWQYSDGGRQNGFLANDLNTASDWYALVLGETAPPPPVIPPVIDTRRLIEVEVQDEKPVIRIDGGAWQ